MFVRRLQLGLCLVGFGLLTNLPAYAGWSNEATEAGNTLSGVFPNGIPPGTAITTLPGHDEAGDYTITRYITPDGHRHDVVEDVAKAPVSPQNQLASTPKEQKLSPQEQLVDLQKQINELKKQVKEQQSQAGPTKGKKVAGAVGRYAQRFAQGLGTSGIGQNQPVMVYPPPAPQLVVPQTGMPQTIQYMGGGRYVAWPNPY